MEKGMSIYKFVYVYFGVSLPIQLDFTHEDLKRLLGLTSCSFDYVNKNYELVSRGNIVLVCDSFNVMLPYKVPEKELESGTTCEVVMDEVRTIDYVDILNKLDKLDTISTYQLRKLLSEFKSIIGVYRCIRKELVRRGVYQNKRYKLEKERIAIEEKERDGNVKYKRKRRVEY